MKADRKRFAAPLYRCRRTRKPPAIDGMISPAIWRQAEAVPLRIATTGKPPQQPAEARLLYDDDCLYVAFHCLDRDAWGSLTRRDDPIYREEVVEVFIDPTRGRRSYIEIEVSPLNTVLDLYILNDPRCPPMRPLWQWNCMGLRTAVHVERGANHRTKFWNCEMAIPFDQLHDAPNIPPKPGDRWRMNLYRIDHLPHLDEYSAWSRITGKSFHCPQCFGELLFLAPGEG